LRDDGLDVWNKDGGGDLDHKMPCVIVNDEPTDGVPFAKNPPYGIRWDPIEHLFSKFYGASNALLNPRRIEGVFGVKRIYANPDPACRVIQTASNPIAIVPYDIDAFP
jgi:hypothetical protein